MKSPRAHNSSPALRHPVIQPVLRRHGDLLIDRMGAPIPTERCFKCNCGAHHEVRKTFASSGGLLRYLVILQPLLIPFLLPFHLLRQDRVSVSFGLCSECRERRNFGLMLGALLLLGSVPFFLGGVLTIATIGPVLGMGGASLFAAGLLTMASSRHLADSRHVDGRWIVLHGGGQPFLKAIPEAPH